MTMHDLIATAGKVSEHDARAIEDKAFGFWIYLMSDAIIFALLFATYAAMSHNTAGGPDGRSLFNLSHTFAETMLLLTSSTTFGFASIATRSAQRTATLFWLAVTFLLGAAFVGMEISEFHGMAAAGADPDRSGFLSAFFTLVGTHGLHVSVGLIWIVLLAAEVAVRGLNVQVASRLYRLGLFWHFLDIVWIAIFSIVYLPGLR
jgi:cytochrome o ubiquinol oxidase subunit 3